MRFAKRRARELALTFSVLAYLSMPAFAAEVNEDEAIPVKETKYSAQDTASAEVEEEAVIHTAPIVVTASGWEQNIKNAPASVSVVTAEDIAKKGYTDFRGILSDVEGVDVMSGTGPSGNARVSIRGMNASHTLFLVDGVPQNGASRSYMDGMQGHGAEIDSFIPPISSIKRIEVVRGPMSTLYGSDAIGGVINIITNKIPDKWMGNFTVDRTFETDQGRANTNRMSLSFRGPLKENNIGFELRGSYIARGQSYFTEPWTTASDARGGNRFPSKLKNWNIGTKLVWTPTERDTYTFDYQHSVNDQTPNHWTVEQNGVQVANPKEQAGYRFDRDTAYFKADNATGFGSMQTTLSYNSTDFSYTTYPEWQGTTLRAGARRDVKDTSITLETKALIDVVDRHQITIGANYIKEIFKDTNLKNGQTFGGGAAGTVTHAPIASSGELDSETYNLFAEDTWSMSDKWDFTYGIRYEHPDRFDPHYTSRAYLVNKLSDKYTIKGGVAGGYKVPTILQTQAGVVASTGRGWTEIYGNPNLKPEKSLSKEIGLYYGDHSGLHWNITYFNNDYKDKIEEMELTPTTLPSGGTPGVIGSSQYVNVDRARTHGIEFAATVPITPKWQFKTSYTYTDSVITAGTGKGQQLNSTPKHMLSMKFDYDADERTNLWLQYQYFGGMERAYNSGAIQYLGREYSSKSIFNLGTVYKISKASKVAFTINNLFDRDYSKVFTAPNGTHYPHAYQSGRSMAGSYVPGRSYWLSYSYDF